MNAVNSRVIRDDYRHNTTAASRLLGISRQRVMRLIELGKLDAVDTSDFGFRDRHHYAKWKISDSSIQERITFTEDWKRRNMLRKLQNMASRIMEVVS